MKTARSLMIVAGLSMAILAVGATGVKAQQGQSLSMTNLAGTFTLPNGAQWGAMTLPAGDYNLYYGTLFESNFVEVRGTAKGSPHGLILVVGSGKSSATKNALVCVREGDTLIVRTLEMPLIGTAAEFAMPRGTKLTAHKGKDSHYAQLAQAPMLIQRIPVALNAK